MSQVGTPLERQRDREGLAYLAGLFDGEGDCGIAPYAHSKNGVRYLRAYARITNTDQAIVQYVRSVFGVGYVGVHYRAGRTKARNANRDCYRWMVTGGKAVEVLRRLRPWLRIKADRVDLILSGPSSGKETAAHAALLSRLRIIGRDLEAAMGPR